MNTLFSKLPLGRKTRGCAGFTLTELALVFAVLGVGTVMIWQVIGLNSAENVSAKSRKALERSAFALERFAHLNNHLPCPATDTKGVSNCAGSTTGTGYVPFLTIGLPLEEAGSLVYSVNNAYPGLTRPPVAQYKIGYASSATHPRLRETLFADYKAGAVGQVDFCRSLIADVAQAGASAFLVGQNPREFAGTGIAPLHIESSRAQLAGKIGCSLLPVGGRSYFNVLSASRILARSVDDYANLLETQRYLNVNGITQSILFASLSAWAGARALTLGLLAMTSFFNSNYRNAGAAIASGLWIAQGVAEIIETFAQLSNIARLSLAQDVWYKQMREMMNLQTELLELSKKVEMRAVSSTKDVVY